VMVTIQPGNKKIECVAGQSLKDITRQARCKIEYNCSRVSALVRIRMHASALPPAPRLTLRHCNFPQTQGECGTCEILVDGKRTRTCVSRLPAKQNVNIKVL